MITAERVGDDQQFLDTYKGGDRSDTE
jgi:hypothetical protein